MVLGPERSTGVSAQEGFKDWTDRIDDDSQVELLAGSVGGPS